MEDAANIGKPWHEISAFTHTLALQVGQQLLQDFGQVQAEAKRDGSLVTRSDRWADQTLREALQQRFPDHGLLSEETTHVFPPNDWCWIIDPLDGTTNFARGIPIWGISLGLLYRGTPVYGYVLIPALNHAFSGFWPGTSGLELPIAAFCNDRPLHVSRDELTSSHLFSFCTRSIQTLQTESGRSQPFPCKIRMIGVATYNLLTVALGASLGGLEATPKVWDIAATWVITQAAGATWISLDQEPFPLQPGVNYRDLSYPTWVLARSDLQPTFEPWARGLKDA